MIALGYGITKAGILTPGARTELTNIVVYIFLPCNIFGAFHKGITLEMLWQSVIVLIAAFGLQLLVLILNKFIFIKLPQERQIILKYTMISNNAAFMGLPILGAVYGALGILYGAIFLIPMRILMWTAGLSLYTRAERMTRVKVLVTHPCMWAVVLGFGYAFAPFHLPAFLLDSIRWVGETTRVLPMVIVGSILCGVKLKDVLDKHCFYFSFFRLVAVPAIMFGVLTAFNIDPVVIGVTVLMAAMPAALLSAILAEKYGHDYAFASKTVFVSTVLSIVTLPLISGALTRLSPV